MEFWMVEPEMAFYSLEDLMAMEEEFVSADAQAVLSKHRMELEILERDVTRLEISRHLSRASATDEAVERIKALLPTIDDPERREELAIEWGGFWLAARKPGHRRRCSTARYLCTTIHRVQGVLHAAGGRPPGSLPQRGICLRRKGTAKLPVAASACLTPTCCKRALAKSAINPEIYNWYLESAALRRCAPRRVWSRRGADRRVDLRPAPHPRDDPLRADA